MNHDTAPPGSMQSDYESATCHYFSSGRCGSCSLLAIPSGGRLAHKIQNLRSALTTAGIAAEILQPCIAPLHPWGSRHKIKMNVAGTLDDPSFGLADAQGKTEDLCGCPLIPPRAQALLSDLKDIVQQARIPPYDITSRRGELKGLIILMNQQGSQGILRFILRSTESIPRICKALGSIQQQHPWVRVISGNIQPVHAAILEGHDEIIVSDERYVEECCAGIELRFSPQSFMQVTPEIAGQLYQHAAGHVAQLSARSALDLFCGVGGFSLASAPFVKRLMGIELSPQAIENASGTAQKLGYSHLHFQSSDVDEYLGQHAHDIPDLVIVNPPRRGLSPFSKSWVLSKAPRHLIYSSCNPDTFCRDAIELAQGYALTSLTPFDMFPLTSHVELLGFFHRV